MRAVQRKLRKLLHTLSYEPRESLPQMAGLGASRVEEIPFNKHTPPVDGHFG